MAFSIVTSKSTGVADYVTYGNHTITNSTDGSGNHTFVTSYVTIPHDLSGKKVQFAAVLDDDIASGDAAVKADLEYSLDNSNWIQGVAAASFLDDLDTAGAAGDVDTAVADMSAISAPYWRLKIMGSNLSGGTATSEYTITWQYALPAGDNLPLASGDFGGIGKDPS
jgi:hypothetical protein